MMFRNPAGDIDHIFPEVTVFGHFSRFALQLAVARPHGEREVADLRGVLAIVDIEFALHLIAVRFEDSCEGVANRRVAPVPQRQGTSGVRAHELNQRAFARADLGFAIPLVFGKDMAHDLPCPTGAQVEVQKACARNLHALHPLFSLRGQVGTEVCGNLAGIAPQQARQRHRRVGGVVAKLRVARHFHLNGWELANLPPLCRCGGVNRLTNPLRNLFAYHDVPPRGSIVPALKHAPRESRGYFSSAPHRVTIRNTASPQR
ncbi:hypothetical protein HRbin14_02117 [bacterium HR14]|nr:hypothetical protein HRbin14_02117 [bacterium HR14]